MARTNPIIPGAWADPYIFRDGTDYYLYPTKDSDGWRYGKFHAFHSTDLAFWNGPFEVLDLGEVAWAHTKAWAPSVVKRGGRYYMYFCAEQQIGVARAESPLGPYADALGRPLIGKDEWGCQSIDPDAFVDSDGQPYLLWGQGKLWIAPLDESMTSFKEAPRCLSDQLYAQRGLDPQATDISLYNEGAHLQKIAGRYLLTWSVYDTRDPRYQVRYAAADSIYGPYELPERNAVIEPTDSVAGTGHASMAQFGGEWYLFYHRMGAGRTGYDRQVCCDPLRFDEAGPVAIVPTE